jgi:hypothetical protein
MRALEDHLTVFAPNALYVEAPPALMGMVQKGTNIDSLQALYGFDMICGVVALCTGTKLASVDVQRARKNFLGYRPAKGSGKSAVALRCSQLGWKPANNNESDAAAIWEYGCAIEQPSALMRERLKQSVRLSGV